MSTRCGLTGLESLLRRQQGNRADKYNSPESTVSQIWMVQRLWVSKRRSFYLPRTRSVSISSNCSKDELGRGEAPEDTLTGFVVCVLVCEVAQYE